MPRQLSYAEKQSLEVEMHQAFGPWVQGHADKPGSGISLIDYNPKKYPEQSIDVGVTEALTLPLPDRLAMFGLRNILLARALGGRKVAASLVEDFKTVSSDVADLLDDGKNVALVPAHKHYADIGIGAGALAVAMGKNRYIKENIYQSINKLMTREKYHGIRISKYSAFTGKILWVIPSEGGKTWKVPMRAMYAVGQAAQEEFEPKLKDPETGVLLSVALTGGALDPVRDPLRQTTVGYKFRDIPTSVGATLVDYDAVIPFAFEKDTNESARWEIGEIIKPPPIDRQENPKEAGLIYTDMAYLKLQEMMERLLRMPVSYQPISALGKAALAGITSRESYQEL